MSITSRRRALGAQRAIAAARVPRWKVPYTAPGSLGGWLIVRAKTRTDAVLAAEATHRKSLRTTGTDGRTRSTVLPVRQRLAIEYGEPVLLTATQAQQRGEVA